MTVTKQGATWARWLGVLALTLLGCGADAARCGDDESCQLAGQVQIATWWGTRGELFVPFDVLKQSLRRTTPLEAELAHPHENKGDHTAWVEEQLDPANPAPEPLDVFSANNGDEVLRWTDCAASGAPPDTPRVLGLTRPELGFSALDARWIRDTFPREVMETLQCDDETYALPIGIHRINTLLYNKGLFRAAGYAVDGEPGVPLPSTLDELHTAAAALAEHLPEAAPGSDLEPSVFAVAGREAWTLSLFVIENLMLALADDAAHYQRYWQGSACDEALLERTLREFVRLRRWFGNWELGSSEAIRRVTSGHAAMMVIGDWAAAEPAREVIGTIPFPGTAKYFVFSADVFALPDISSADPGKGLAWLRAVTGDRTQREFSAAKGALSARTELEGELAPGRPSAPEWVRALPAILPYAPISPFRELQDQLQSWLYSMEDTGAPVLEYARQEYPELSHGTVSCTPEAFDPAGVR